MMIVLKIYSVLVNNMKIRLLLGLFVLQIISLCKAEDCDGLLKAVLQHNSPEFVGFSIGSSSGDGDENGKDLLHLSFTWDHIHSLIKDCASFYLLERRALSYGKVSKRESSYHTSEISQPLHNGSGYFSLHREDCQVYSVQLTVSSSVDGSLHYSQGSRIWPRAYSDNRISEISDSSLQISWPRDCQMPRRWRLLAISTAHDPVRSRNAGFLGGLQPCTPYEIVLEDAEESPVWSTRLVSKPSPPQILVIPGHRSMTVTTTTGNCPSSELTTEITYCTEVFSEEEDGSGDEAGFSSQEEETCVTRTLSESGTPKRILLKNLSPCTIYSLRFRTVDMSADIAENTLLQEYDAAHSTLCMRKEGSSDASAGLTSKPTPTTSRPTTTQRTTTAETDGFWFDHTTEEDSNHKERNHHMYPEITKPDIRRAHPTNHHLGLDVTIGISLGLSCLFILIGATVIASVFHLYYNNKTSPKFSKISHMECEEEGHT